MDFISLTVITSKRSKRVNQVIPGVQQPSSSVVYCAPTQSKPFALPGSTPNHNSRLPTYMPKNTCAMHSNTQCTNRDITHCVTTHFGCSNPFGCYSSSCT